MVTTRDGGQAFSPVFSHWPLISSYPYRDSLVQAALGTQSFNGVTYSTTAETLKGVMVVGTEGVNHGTSCATCLVLMPVTLLLVIL